MLLLCLSRLSQDSCHSDAALISELYQVSDRSSPIDVTAAARQLAVTGLVSQRSYSHMRAVSGERPELTDRCDSSWYMRWWSNHIDSTEPRGQPERTSAIVTTTPFLRKHSSVILALLRRGRTFHAKASAESVYNSIKAATRPSISLCQSRICHSKFL